jgi:hypothetical protein
MGDFDGWAVRLGNPAGDFSADDARDCDDIDALVAEIVAGTNNAGFDITADGIVNLDDLTHWRLIVGDEQLGPGRSYLPADANLDGVVDFLDFNIWASNRFTNNASWCMGDFNASGVIDFLDFNIWAAYRFQSSAVVPEPGSLVLLLIGLGVASATVRARPNG